MPPVTVKTGGTHQFGSPGEAAEFLDVFLEKAGVDKDYSWEARLEKTAHCSWDSPPVRVVGFKHWVIYLRVKPSINATVDHFVSLLIPDGSGYAAESIYRQMKEQVKSFNRLVRSNGFKRKPLEPIMDREAADAPPVSPPPAAREEPAETVPVNGVAPPEPVAPEAGPEYVPSFDENLAGVTRNPDKLRYTLVHIDRVSQLGLSDALTFKKTLRREAGWTQHALRAVSLILAWLVKHGYVAKEFGADGQVTNYRLTPKGEVIAASPPRSEGAAPAAPRPLPRTPTPEIDVGSLLIRFRDKAQELADAGRRLEANRDKYRELQAQIKLLDDEYNEIAKLLIADREATALLARLLEVQGAVPVRS